MRKLLREIWRRDPVLAFAGWLQLIALAAVLVVAPFDEREILGINRWIKPMKFLVSVAIYLWTVAWFMPYVSGPRWAKALIRWSVAAALVVENACIVMQSVRGVQSHFNVSTAFDGINFGTMGIMILINTLMLVLLLLLMFVKPSPTLPRPYLWAVRLGLLFIVLGSLEGAYMIGQGAHAVGVPDGGPGLPFVNWSTDGGDLRIAHGLGLHGVQILPLFAYLLGRLKPGLPASMATAVVFGFALAYGAAAALLLARAVAAQPLLAL